MHYIYMEVHYVIKGHVTIELHNHKTGLRDRIEGDNMVTNALNYVIPIVMGGNTSAENLMPLCKKALGSLMLFDGTLTEDKNNMFLPAEAHLVAFADRGLDTTHSDRGSLNSAETYQTDTGYQSVWDFSTSQANGTIKSLALSLNYSFDGSYIRNSPYNLVGPFKTSGPSCKNLGNKTEFYCYALCYDVENQYLYYIDPELGGVSSRTERDDTGKTKYLYSTEIHIMKAYVPTTKFKLADYPSPTNYGEEVTSFTIETGTSDTDCRGYFKNGYDGYAYMITPVGTAGKVEMYKLKLSDYSFEISEVQTFTVKSVNFYNNYGHSTANNGKAYIKSLDKKTIYIVNLSNTVDVQEVKLPNDYTLSDDYLMNLKNGGVKFSTSDSRFGICYPDGKVIINQQNGNYGNDPIRNNPWLITDNLVVFGHRAYYYRSYSTGSLLNNYLGTIYNLPQPIVKTAASSMKVVYTLTDID